MIQLVCFIWGTDTILQQKSMKQKCYPKGLVGNQAEVVTSTLSRSKKGHPLAHPLFRDWKLSRVICLLKQRSCSEVIWIHCVAPLKVLRTKQIHSGDGFNLPGSWKVDVLTWARRKPPVAHQQGRRRELPRARPAAGQTPAGSEPSCACACPVPGAGQHADSRPKEENPNTVETDCDDVRKKTTSELNVVLNSRVTSKGTC